MAKRRSVSIDTAQYAVAGGSFPLLLRVRRWCWKRRAERRARGLASLIHAGDLFCDMDGELWEVTQVRETWRTTVIAAVHMRNGNNAAWTAVAWAMEMSPVAMKEDFEA